jgi:hypothetical protein
MLFSKRTLKAASLIVSIVVVSIGFLTSQPGSAKSIAGLEKFKDDVRKGLAEIGLPLAPDQQEIDAGVKRFVGFVHYRSGLEIGDSNLSLLTSKELEARMSNTGASNRELSDHIAKIALERTSLLSDSEIDYLAENLRGFYFPGLPEGYRKGRSKILMRGDGRGWMDLEEFRIELRKIRDSGVNPIMRQIIAHEIGREFSKKVRFLADVEPIQFGEAETRMTPLQALLIVYSISAEDPLAHDRKGLEQSMRSLQEGLYRITGTAWPDHKGYRAYGENGYLRPSPVKVILDDAMIKELLDLF